MCNKTHRTTCSKSWGSDQDTMTNASGIRVSLAVSQLMVYNNSYLRKFGTSIILRWDDDFTTEIKKCTSRTLLASQLYNIKTKYVELIED